MSLLVSDVPRYFAMLSDEEWASSFPRRILMAPFIFTLLCQIQEKAITTWAKKYFFSVKFISES